MCGGQHNQHPSAEAGVCTGTHKFSQIKWGEQRLRKDKDYWVRDPNSFTFISFKYCTLKIVQFFIFVPESYQMWLV